MRSECWNLNDQAGFVPAYAMSIPDLGPYQVQLKVEFG